MKTTLRLEELAMAAISIYFLLQHNLNLSVWIWIPLFFAPDLSMIGYLVNAKIGAFSYNLFHHKGIALVLVFAGKMLNIELIFSIGLLLFAHSSFDRMLGYGLKYSTGFKDTHLGSLEKK